MQEPGDGGGIGDDLEDLHPPAALGADRDVDGEDPGRRRRRTGPPATTTLRPGPTRYSVARMSAKHGAAVALLQRDSAAQALVVGECTRFVAESGDRLLVGVNDRAHRNNSGELTFEVRVAATDAETWSGGGTESCGV